MSRRYSARLAATCLILAAWSPLQAAGLDVDLALTNGNIRTIDANGSIVSTVVIDDGKIIAVGTEAILADFAPQQVLDLKGRTVLPGFVDNHVHPTGPRGFAPTVVNLRHAYTWPENVRLLKEAVAGMPPGAWIRASAFRTHFADDFPTTPWFNTDLSQVPDRHALDKISPDNPMIVRVSQFVVANTLALRLGGITRDG
ncbi:MAG: hypothetical protein EOP02_11420, partial [Proteobacteria bacterium]